MKKRDKRGVSEVLVTVLLVVFSLIAIGIIWAVISNLIKEKSEDINIEGFFVDLKIESVQEIIDGNYVVRVKRNQGIGNVSMVKFVVSDGENTEVINKDTSGFVELETRSFTFNQNELGNIVFIKEISIVPVISGRKDTGITADKKVFSNKEILQKLGAVSFWKLDGNVRDEIGNNHGLLQGGVTFVDGKYGQAASFDGINGLVSINSGHPPSDITISFWFRTSSKTASSSRIFWVQYAPASGFNQNGARYVYINSVGGLRWGSRSISGTWRTNGAPAETWNENEWTHFVAVQEGDRQLVYVGGVLRDTLDTSEGLYRFFEEMGDLGNSNNNPNWWYNGELDEIVIFNKALSERQIEGLYNLNMN